MGRKGIIACVIGIGLMWATSAFGMMGAGMPSSEMIGMMLNQSQTRNSSKLSKEDQAITQMQEFLLQLTLLQPLMNAETSLLTEEDKEKFGYLGGQEIQNELVVKLFAQKLAEQDALGLKKMMTRRPQVMLR